MLHEPSSASLQLDIVLVDRNPDRLNALTGVETRKVKVQS